MHGGNATVRMPSGLALVKVDPCPRFALYPAVLSDRTRRGGAVSSTVRGVAGGMLIGGGVAIGAYSGGWFLILAVLFVVLGSGLIVTLSRSPLPAAGGIRCPST